MIMATNKKIPPIRKNNKTIAEKIKRETDIDSIPLIVNFSKFNLTSVNIPDRFNNHYKDYQHVCNVVSGFLGTILPKISKHSFNEIREGGPEGRAIHFHAIDETHREIIREILLEYKMSSTNIDQLLEGDNLFNFSAVLGHTNPARVICQKIDNVLYILFLDTNHHIYINKKYTEETLFYEICPTYANEECVYMPEDCYAVSYLDEKKLKESLGYTYSPT